MKVVWLAGYFLLVGMCLPPAGHAMHIMEGFLPRHHELIWIGAVVPFLVPGVKQIGNILKYNPEQKTLLALAAASIFVVSALTLPSVTGSSSHVTGIGLSTILFGPAVSVVISAIVLLCQAVLLAHGGIGTWGANTFSMGVAGAFTAWGLFKICRGVGIPSKIAVFFAAVFGDWATYMVTAAQLAWAFPDPAGGIWLSFVKFLRIFAVTQMPMAMIEGVLSIAVYNKLLRCNKQGLIKLWRKSKFTK